MASLHLPPLFQAPCGISVRCFLVQFFRCFLVAVKLQIRPLSSLSFCPYNWRISTGIFMKFYIGVYQDRLSGQFKFEWRLTILRTALQVFLCDQSQARKICRLEVLLGQQSNTDSWIKMDQLDVTCLIISLFTAQYVSNVSTSIFRSLWLIVDLFHVLYCFGSMCVGVTVWFGWGGVVSLCRLKPA